MNSLEKRYLKFPAPYIGAKTKIAREVWRRFGDVDRLIEPFMGSCAVTLARPLNHFRDGKNRSEIVNDRHSYLVNFFRAVRNDPESVADYVDWPVTEADLIARYQYLAFGVNTKAFRRKIKSDPDYYDPKLAGWWVWGMACWIGTDAWFSMSGNNQNKIPEIYSPKGLVKPTRIKLIESSTPGLGAILTHPIKRKSLNRWMEVLSNRLRYVSVTCGDWKRVVDSESLLQSKERTGVFFDPPYPSMDDKGNESSKHLYERRKNVGSHLLKIRDNLLEWCLENGNGKVRVAVCGYEGNGYEPLLKEGWSVYKWKTKGGYANVGQNDESKAKKNRLRERIYFSPSCLKPATLF